MREIEAMAFTMADMRARLRSAEAEVERQRRELGIQDNLIDRWQTRAEDLQADIERLREAIEEYLLWAPGRRGHAEAHHKLYAALREEER